MHDDGVMRDAQGRALSFEILLNQSGSSMRTAAEMRQVVDIFSASLRNLGITPTVTVLDPAQFIQRTNNYQFDMTWYERARSLSPGNEQMLYWGHQASPQPGTRNWMGMNSPSRGDGGQDHRWATTREDYLAATRALDRILTAGQIRHPGQLPRADFALGPLCADLDYPEYIPLYGDWPGFHAGNLVA
ncbi:hypothetical protein PE067_06075 [Paracoccus sp. DMF-8]|uniref:hypothetical protein n=1 Tax=Paracoccus sp. DMF-8 TaxID=3019445 RepID=UPI0023E8B8DB|nr:hypothetical protein [Paracoccus sp. DMF-8]MDF3605751.1 hypothetical protein [Paracoccus sp. DMF-8]